MKLSQDTLSHCQDSTVQNPLSSVKVEVDYVLRDAILVCQFFSSSFLLFPYPPPSSPLPSPPHSEVAESEIQEAVISEDDTPQPADCTVASVVHEAPVTQEMAAQIQPLASSAAPVHAVSPRPRGAVDVDAVSQLSESASRGSLEDEVPVTDIYFVSVYV